MEPLNPATDGASANIVDENLAKLRELFPDAFTESSEDGEPRWKVDFDALREVLGDAIEDKPERYSFNWNGKSRAKLIANTPTTATLRPCPEESVNWDTTKNLFIEGDNLEVLKLLQKSYHRKVKVVYIDPPYNTGNEFIYPDKFQDNLDTYLRFSGQVDDDGFKLSANAETSGRYHTNWLNMMLPRLKLARSMLSEDGIFLASIDDHEVHNFRGLCNEVFGEENFVATLVWEKGRKNDAKLFSVGHEYLFVIAKSLATLKSEGTVWREEKPGSKEIWDQYMVLRGKHGTDDRAISIDLAAWYSSLPKSHPSKKWSRYKRVDSFGPWRDRDISWPGGDGPRYDVIHPRTKQPCKVPDDGWRFSKPEEMKRQIELGLVEFRDDHTEPPFRKAHIRPPRIDTDQDDVVELDTESDEVASEYATQVRGSYFYKQSQVAVKALKAVMGAKVFDNPKDHVELSQLFQYVSAGDEDAVFLDFFAGSGTTAQSVCELNASDNGRRRFILVQLPEALDPDNKAQKAAVKLCDKMGLPRNIAELTKERLRRVCCPPAESKDSGEGGFRAFRLSSSSLVPWDSDFDSLEDDLYGSIENIKSDRVEADVLYELLLKYGLDLAEPIEERVIAGSRVFSVGAGALVVCLAESIGLDVVEGIVALKAELKPEVTRVVFRDSGFKDDVVKANAVQILKQAGLADEQIRSL